MALLSLAQRLAARIEQSDDWDDGGDIILDKEAGARITSYTGPHAWDAGARHVAPSAVPILKHVRKEIQNSFEALPPERADEIRGEFILRCQAFDQSPSMPALLDLAELVDRFVRLYADVDPHYDIGTADDIVESDFGWNDDE